MSNRSIVEINHDYWHRIAAEPEVFAKLLDRALGSGSKEEWLELERFGFRFGLMAHHSDDRWCATKHRKVDFV